MKKHAAILLIAGLFIFAGAVIGWIITTRHGQREWPGQQLGDAVALGTALSSYREIHGSYPARLEGLVTGGTLNQATFEKLQFRAEPRADPEAWLYKAPDQPSDIAIVGPKAIFPWSGHSGFIVTARADGGGELILVAKGNRVPAWAKK